MRSATRGCESADHKIQVHVLNYTHPQHSGTHTAGLTMRTHLTPPNELVNCCRDNSNNTAHSTPAISCSLHCCNVIISLVWNYPTIYHRGKRSFIPLMMCCAIKALVMALEEEEECPLDWWKGNREQTSKRNHLSDITLMHANASEESPTHACRFMDKAWWPCVGLMVV